MQARLMRGRGRRMRCSLVTRLIVGGVRLFVEVDEGQLVVVGMREMVVRARESHLEGRGGTRRLAKRRCAV